MKYKHGLKLSDKLTCPNFIKIMNEKLDVDMMSKKIVIIQIHIANTIEPVDPDYAVFLSYDQMKKNIFPRLSDSTRYKAFFWKDLVI